MKILVAEYPKSGGTWLTNLIGDALGLPKRGLGVALNNGKIFFDVRQHPWYEGVEDFGLPESCVVKSHELPNSPKVNFSAAAIHLIRDGRDVIVSKFFYEQDFLVKNGFSDQLKISETAFEDYIVRTAKEWVNFVTAWQSNEAVVQCRYEALLQDPVTTLTTLVEQLGVSFDRERILQSVNRNTKEKMRKAFDKTFEYNTFVRKGIAGDWQNHFSEADEQTFRNIAGDLMIQLGYDVKLKQER